MMLRLWLSIKRKGMQIDGGRQNLIYLHNDDTTSYYTSLHVKCYLGGLLYIWREVRWSNNYISCKYSGEQLPVDSQSPLSYGQLYAIKGEARRDLIINLSL